MAAVVVYLKLGQHVEIGRLAVVSCAIGKFQQPRIVATIAVTKVAHDGLDGEMGNPH